MKRTAKHVTGISIALTAVASMLQPASVHAQPVLPKLGVMGCAGALAPEVAPVHHIVGSQIGVWLRGEPYADTGNREYGPVDGDVVRVMAQTTGDPMGDRSNTIWNYVQLADGRVGYVPDAWTDTPTEANQFYGAVPQCGAQTSVTPVAEEVVRSYNGEAAAQWARDHVWDDESFDENCTWFVSQALWAGGMPTSDEWTGKSWDWDKQAARSHYPGPTVTAAYAPSLVDYLVANGLATMRELPWTENDIPDAQLGDLIVYKWNNDDELIDHAMIITALEGARPFVTGQTIPLLDQYWSWSSVAGDWIELAYPGSKAYLVHITY